MNDWKKNTVRFRQLCFAHFYVFLRKHSTCWFEHLHQIFQVAINEFEHHVQFAVWKVSISKCIERYKTYLRRLYRTEWQYYHAADLWYMKFHADMCSECLPRLCRSESFWEHILRCPVRGLLWILRRTFLLRFFAVIESDRLDLALKTVKFVRKSWNKVKTYQGRDRLAYPGLICKIEDLRSGWTSASLNSAFPRYSIDMQHARETQHVKHVKRPDAVPRPLLCNFTSSSNGSVHKQLYYLRNVSNSTSYCSWIGP